MLNTPWRKSAEVRPVDGVTAAQAAALPTASLTAWFGLKTDGALKSGEWLLVHGGSSGVGVAAIQIAKHFGSKVIATSGSEVKCRRLRQLGADVTIDVSENDFLPEVMRITGNRGVDVVLEMIGGEVYQKSLQALAPEDGWFPSAAPSAPSPIRRRPTKVEKPRAFRSPII